MQLDSLYNILLIEGIEEKIPKLLNLVKPEIENKEDYIRWAADTFDPSPNKQYITWILRMLKTDVLRGEEDAGKTKEYLEKLTALKRNRDFPKEKRDINSYKSFGDLAETIDEFEGLKSKKEIVRIKTEEGIQLLASENEDPLVGISVYVVTTPEAASKHFRGTEWCVKDPKFFDYYSPQIYYYITKDGNPNHLVHLNSNQCKDVYDREQDLSDIEKEQMESEEVTKYVLENENDFKSLGNYTRIVGSGYDEEISGKVTSALVEIIHDANEKLKMFSIHDYYLEEYVDLHYIDFSASGSIEYDLSEYEEHLNDKEFKRNVLDVLAKHEIYSGDDIYGDLFSHDNNSIYFDVRHDRSYGQQSLIDELKDFVGYLEDIENSFDIEEFKENLEESLLENGFMSSGWSTFKNRIDIESIKLKNFKKERGVYNSPLFETHEIHNYTFDDSQRPNNREFTIKNANFLLKRHKKNEHPYMLLVIFLKPLLDNGMSIDLNNDASSYKLKTDFKYEKDKTAKQYMRMLKVLKSVDTHFEFYTEQIKDFVEEYVEPFFKNYQKTGEYGIPEDIKLPLLKIKTRKDPEEQMVFDLRETTDFKSFFYNRRKFTIR